MPKKSRARDRGRPPAKRPMQDKETSVPASSEKVEEGVWDVLEAARERVRSLVKREQEGMVLHGDLANLRLDARR